MLFAGLDIIFFALVLSRFKYLGRMIAHNKAIPAATKNKPRQDKTNNKLLKSNVVATELIRELVAINPQIRPCLSGEKPARIIFAIDGQPADFENIVKKGNSLLHYIVQQEIIYWWLIEIFILERKNLLCMLFILCKYVMTSVIVTGVNFSTYRSIEK